MKRQAFGQAFGQRSVSIIVLLATLIWRRSSVDLRPCRGHQKMSPHSSYERPRSCLEMTEGPGVALKPTDWHSLHARGLFSKGKPKAYCPDHIALSSRVTVHYQRCAHSGDCGAAANIELDRCLEVTVRYLGDATVWLLGVPQTNANEQPAVESQQSESDNALRPQRLAHQLNSGRA